ncbi:stage III sporulation protein AG [Virgibacillus natechei]|uniref:Stage III sporulation protein AG n=1 Tax=Virgibacillus natechei TaxID=1216297 RepID=A0ABS4II96_9BACI|nr:stage III sporulation protein AG [Virgibacillus natechei]MBP1969714.1 stage III sporulation protein AG [Virgibacillus natechei]UZD11439.1 stage III sporulation protein AG [Virgibacillus natechei]
MIKKFGKFFQSKDSDNNSKTPSKKTGYIIVLALVGLLLLILGNVFSSPEESNMDTDFENQVEQDSQETSSEEVSATADVDELEESFKKDLENMLNKIQGVSEAEVMVNLDSTNVKVYEKDLVISGQTTDEDDSNGGTRQVEDNTEETQVVLVRQGDQEVPLLTQTEKPDVRGVFVVAKGADNSNVKNWMVESISRVLDVPTHRVSVMPRN